MLILLKQEDHEAFEEIYHRYWSGLFAFAYNRLNSRHLGEEVVQEIFLNLWNRRIEADRIVSLQAYLFTAVKYSVLNVIKAEHVKRKYADNYSNFISLALTNNIEETLAEKDLEDALRGQVANLPPQCRKIFQLSRMQHLSISDIAALLNLSHKTVENQLSKALKTLRLGLTEFFFLVITIFS